MLGPVRALLFLLLPCAAAAQTVRVSGVVSEEGQGPVRGATVYLTGSDPVTTDSAGRFRFAPSLPGRAILTVAAPGYQLRGIELTIMSDTSIEVRVTRRTATLDTVVVRARNIRIKGTAVDSATGDYLVQAQAILYPGGTVASATSGVFVFENVAAGQTTIIVEALERLPRRVDLSPSQDTTITVRMAFDSVALRMIAAQVKRLEARQKSVAMPATILNREALMRESAPSVGDLIMRRMYEDPVTVRQGNVTAANEGCFFLDDVKVTRDVFDGVLPEMVERVEVYKEAGQSASMRSGPINRRTSVQNRGGVRMIRVYTKRYVASLPRQETLSRVTYVPGARLACA